MSLSSTAIAYNPPTPPFDDERINEGIALLGRARREIKMLDAEMNQRIADIKAEYERRATDPKMAAAVCEKVIREYCVANRKRLTRDGAVKYHRFPAGDVIWRMNPPSVTVGKKALSTVLAYLHSKKLGRFIRLTETIDKEAMLAEPEVAATIDGVRITRGRENFVIEPVEVPLSQGTGD